MDYYPYNLHRTHNTNNYLAPVLQVSTAESSAHEHDERTARPGNAHLHAQFHNALSTHSSITPGIEHGLSRPLKPQEQDRLAVLDRLKFFLATAPSRWDSPSQSQTQFAANFTPPNAYPSADGSISSQDSQAYHAPPHPSLNRFLLPSQEFVTCVLWNSLYHITGTDIVRALVFRFEAFGRPVRNMKKFEEGVFSDLRNLKPGVDACLEEPKSPFLDLLFKYQCIRTQKKQKVFYWFSVPHDRLFLDALERDLKREKMGLEATTHILGEPALSFKYDPKRSLYEQFSKAQGTRDGEGELEAAVRIATETGSDTGDESAFDSSSSHADFQAEESEGGVSDLDDPLPDGPADRKRALQNPALFPMLTLFEGSPTYKQRRKKNTKIGGTHSATPSALRKGSEEYQDEQRYEQDSVGRERVVPRHTSMMEEFGPNSASSREAKEQAISAADMYWKQARGELVPGDGVIRKPQLPTVVGEVGVFYSAGNPQSGMIQQQQQQQQHQQHQQQQQRHHTYPGANLSPAYSTNTFSQTDMSAFAPAGAEGKIKVYVCHLFSCGRMFKRMEHLKRHARTHTLERPFACTRCPKTFSRSDNLNQHLRTHDRPGVDSTGTAWGAGEEGGEGMVRGVPNANANAGGEEDMLRGAFGEGGVFEEARSEYDIDVDAYEHMCEVEVVPSDVQEVQGDEEGLIMRASTGVDVVAGAAFVQQGQDAYYPLSSAGSESLFTSSDTWRAQPSPAFSSGSVPSPPPSAIPHIRSNRSLNAMRQASASHSSSSSAASSAYGDDFLTSVSAPSHKHSFEHGSLYPPSMLDSAVVSTGPGPIRRHRSMTPSLIRNGEPIRRPMTANSSEFPIVATGGSPGSNGSVLGSARGYHPYAPYGSSSSRGGSAQSSPSAYPIPLANEYGNIRRSESRNSSYGGTILHEQMRQMMNMNLDQQADQVNTNAVAGGVFGDAALYRTDSPAQYGQQQTESPGAYVMDLPMQFGGEPFVGQHHQHQQHHHQHHHQHHQQQQQHQYDKHGQFLLHDQTQAQSYAMQTGMADGYYGHPQHVTL